MGFSRGCGYGILTVLYLASKSDRRPRTIRDIAANLEIPFPFLTKIARTLVLKGILCSHKGPGGGMTLARPATEITLGQVVTVIDGSERSCVLGVPGCSGEEECPFWECRNKIQSGMDDLLERKTVSQVLVQMTNKDRFGITELNK